MERKDVYKAIDTERDYQDELWCSNENSKRQIHSPEEWLMYIEDYVNEAKHILSREPYGICEPKAMNIMRKIAAMSVCAMEQHGTTNREK